MPAGPAARSGARRQQKGSMQYAPATPCATFQRKSSSTVSGNSAAFRSHRCGRNAFWGVIFSASYEFNRLRQDRLGTNVRKIEIQKFNERRFRRESPQATRWSGWTTKVFSPLRITRTTQPALSASCTTTRASSHHSALNKTCCCRGTSRCTHSCCGFF